MKKCLFNDNWRIKRLGDSHEFSLHWENVELPHDAVIGTQRKSGLLNGTKKAFFENGAWEYVKVFDVPEEWKGQDVYLEFEGVQSHAMFYVNGQYVGKHACGYTECLLSIADALEYGTKNVIKIVCRVNDDSRWYTGGGIYRNVNLLVTNKLHIKNNGLKIATISADHEKAVLEMSVDVSFEKEVILETKIYEQGKPIVSSVQTINGTHKWQIEIENPCLWTADTPYLYECRACLKEGEEKIDEAVEVFGIRTLSINAKQGFLINGKSEKLRGACIHHDNGVLGVKTLKEVEYRKIRILKKAGFNAIRSAHHPASRYLLDACDELGMYVMDEAFDTWQISKSSDDYANDFDENWKQDIKAMVDKDYNRPSVIMYSIGNEISDLATETGVALAHEISREVKCLDATRYTTVAINGLLLLMHSMEKSTQLKEENEIESKQDINETMSSLDDVMVRINNTSFMDQMIQGGCDAVDVAGYNYMHNRYEADIEKYPDRVIVGSETYAKYIADMWEHIKNHNNVIGDFTWTGWDYLGETGIGVVSYKERDYHQGFYAGYPCITASCGDIDITGYRLPQSYYREIVFGLRKEPYIVVYNPLHLGEEAYLSTWGWGDVHHNWSYDNIHGDIEGKLLNVEVYASEETELFLNRKSLGCKKPEKNRCKFQVPYERGVLAAVTKIDGMTYCDSLETAKGEEVLDLQLENESFQKGELLFLQVSFADKNGNVFFQKEHLVELLVEGGILLGFGSGASCTEENYCDNVHTTYDSRAFAVIRATENCVKVRAIAEGFETERIFEGR